MKILLSKPGLDGHDVGVKVLAHALIEAGFEVHYTGLRKSVETILELAESYQVDMIGLSILSGTHKVICDHFSTVMEERNLNFPWVVGGNIPLKDVDDLMSFDPVKVFPTGSRMEDIVDFFKQFEAKNSN